MNDRLRFLLNLWLLSALLALPVLACGLGNSNNEANQTEEVNNNNGVNENAAAATSTPLPNITQPLLSDAPVSGALDANTQTYTFTVPAGGILDITLTYGDGYTTYATLSLAGAQLGFASASEGFPGEIHYQTANSHDPNAVFSLEMGADGPATYEVLLTTSLGQEGDDMVDAGNSPDAAALLTPGSSYNGALSDADLEDYYRFTAPAGAIIELMATTSEESYSTYFDLWRDDAMLISAGASFGFPGTFRYQLNESNGGEFYLRVAAEGLSHYDFKLTMTVVAEGDGVGDAGTTPEQATPITASQSYSGSLADDDLHDYYRINTSKGAPITINVTQPGEGYTVYFELLHNGELVTYGSASQGFPGSVTWESAVGGEYIIHFAADGPGSYVFTVETELVAAAE